MCILLPPENQICKSAAIYGQNIVRHVTHQKLAKVYVHRALQISRISRRPLECVINLAIRRQGGLKARSIQVSQLPRGERLYIQSSEHAYCTKHTLDQAICSSELLTVLFVAQ